MISVCARCVCVAPEGAGSAPQASAPLKERKTEAVCIRERHRGEEEKEESTSSFRQQEWQAVFHLQPTDRQREKAGMPPICLLIIHLLSSGCHKKPGAKNGVSLLSPVINFTLFPLMSCSFTHFFSPFFICFCCPCPLYSSFLFTLLVPP